ncbi:MAG: S-methyl-5-thioribose kinase [Paracoccaceae bacterium]
MSTSKIYEPLTLETLVSRLKTIDTITSILGSDTTKWTADEIGDGNLNLVFNVTGAKGSLIVKQALPYVRLVGDSWPLPLTRAFFEYNSLVRQNKRSPGSVPKVFFFDEVQALIVMEFLYPHKILRGKLIAGEKVTGLAEELGLFCARTLFRGSDLSMKTSDKKSDVALFLGNKSLCDITESLVFTDPYFDAKMNHNTSGLESIIERIREDISLKVKVQHALMKFSSNTETLCHGDLHSGSVMCTANDTKIIDPEFGFYGPMGFDIGMLISNFLMAYISQPAHRSPENLVDFQEWILDIITEFYEMFKNEFSILWKTERTGILYPKSLFEDQGHSSEKALEELLNSIWQDALTVSGIEIHRRILSLAHNADFEDIRDQTNRATLEAKALMMGKELIQNNRNIIDTKALLKIARHFNQENYL